MLYKFNVKGIEYICNEQRHRKFFIPYQAARRSVWLEIQFFNDPFDLFTGILFYIRAVVQGP